MGKLLSADAVWAADDLVWEDIPIPEWTPDFVEGVGDPSCLRLRIMTAKEAIDFAKAMENPNNERSAIVRGVMKTAIDEEGKLLFTGSGDFDKLLGKSLGPYKRIRKVFFKLNGFGTDEDEEESESAEEVAKND